MTRPRIALFVLEALPNARTIRRFVGDHAGEIVLVGLSDPMRPATGGTMGQVRRHLARSGPRFLPYLAVNFGLPDLLRPMAPLFQAIGRAGASSAATPLRTLCARLGVPTIDIEDVNGSGVHEALRRAAPDLILTFHFDQILSDETIALARLAAVNVHPGLLPRHRGPVPTIHALAEAVPAFGVTVHRTVSRIDAGAILVQSALDLPPGTTATGASVRLHEAGRLLVEDLLDTIARTGSVPAGKTAPLLPYGQFPSRTMLADLARRGLRLTDGRDVTEALTLCGRR